MLSFLRVLKFAVQGFFRNFWLSLVTITMMLMAVISVTLLVSMNYIKEATISGVENKVDILVELKPKVTQEQVDTFVIDLERLSEIKDVKVITPEENKELFRQYNLNSKVKEALDIYGEDENPFSYFLAIKAYNLEQYPKILEFVGQDKYLTLVEGSNANTHQDFIDKINNISNFVNRYSWYLAGIFVLISIVVIFNTIRISIYTRREEIMIMKLVGAGNWFVRMPFIIESVLYALAAMLIVILVIYPLVNFVQPGLNNYFQGLQVIDLLGYFRKNFVEIFVYQFIVLAILNIVSTTLAVRKYLKV